MTQGGYQVIIILPIKSKMAAAKKWCFPGGATYIPLHVVITDQTLSFFTQNTDMPKD